MTDPVAIFRTLADDTRWRIVRMVMGHALCVCELADILGMPQSSVSSHVQIIRRAGLLEEETCGKWTYFRIAPAWLVPLRTIMKQFPDTGKYADDSEKTEARLARRASSCCPGPVKLTARRKTTTS